MSFTEVADDVIISWRGVMENAVCVLGNFRFARGRFPRIVAVHVEVCDTNLFSFSLNAIVDVRLRPLRRHEMIFFSNISETVRDSDFKINDRLDHDSLYISTGNEVINYFRSAANRTNV